MTFKSLCIAAIAAISIGTPAGAAIVDYDDAWSLQSTGKPFGGAMHGRNFSDTSRSEFGRPHGGWSAGIDVDGESVPMPFQHGDHPGGIVLLNLFDGPVGHEDATVTATPMGGATTTLSIFGHERAEGDHSGYAFLDLSHLSNVISMRALAQNLLGGDGNNEHSIAAVVVPLPLGLILMLTAVGTFVVLARRRSVGQTA